MLVAQQCRKVLRSPAHISEVELDSFTAVCHRTPRYLEARRTNGGTAAAAAGTVQLSL